MILTSYLYKFRRVEVIGWVVFYDTLIETVRITFNVELLDFLGGVYIILRTITHNAENTLKCPNRQDRLIGGCVSTLVQRVGMQALNSEHDRDGSSTTRSSGY